MPDQDDDQRQDYDERLTWSSCDKPITTPAQKSPNRLGATGLGLGIGVIVVGILLLYFVSQGTRQGASRIQSSNSLEQIGRAIYNYNVATGELPHNTYTWDGRPLLSWRVHILPFIEGDALYRRFNLNEPWDGPTNLPLLAEMPQIYALGTDRRKATGTNTHYRGFSDPGSIFERRLNERRPRVPFPFVRLELFNLDSLKDGMSNTILVIEARDAVEWTKPDGLDASPGKPLPKLGGLRSHDGKFIALMGDGRVRSFPVDIDEAELRALISHSGGEIVTLD